MARRRDVGTRGGTGRKPHAIGNHAGDLYGRTLVQHERLRHTPGRLFPRDFELSVRRVPDRKGDRVRITLNGKFLPYRTW